MEAEWSPAVHSPRNGLGLPAHAESSRSQDVTSLLAKPKRPKQYKVKRNTGSFRPRSRCLDPISADKHNPRWLYSESLRLTSTFLTPVFPFNLSWSFVSRKDTEGFAA